LKTHATFVMKLGLLKWRWLFWPRTAASSWEPIQFN